MRAIYFPGTSWLHRAPAGWKLVGVTVAMVLVVVFRAPTTMIVAALTVTALYLSAGFGPRTLWRQVRPLRWLVVGVIGLQVLVGGGAAAAWRTGLVVAGTIVVAVAIAGLLTLTTQVSALLDTVERALRPAHRIGVDSERVALTLALTIRTIPVIGGLAEQIRDALRARGVTRSVRAYAVPLVVRSLRHADALGEALVARGVDDSP